MTTTYFRLVVISLLILSIFSCSQSSEPKTATEVKPKQLTAEDILGNPEYQAISFGGYRHPTRDIQPNIAELKEDMIILHAMGVRIVRTYNLELPHAANVVKAISELKLADPTFEMYVMLGTWINCKNAWTPTPNHEEEAAETNAAEIARAVKLAQAYPEIIKVIAVGNEAMVRWATSYFVQAKVILKYVNQLQLLKDEGKLSKDLWITSSDNFASWGGGDRVYHTEDLAALVKAVDYISMHTYPMHDTHYNPTFWGNTADEASLTDVAKIDKAMNRALEYSISQYGNVKAYMESLGVSKPIHIGETGWASESNGFYGPTGSKACDEYKQAMFYHLMRNWTNANGIACFYFEAFDEPWKDATNKGGSENHFGLFTVDGKAKHALWDEVDAGVFDGLTRGLMPIVKTYDGNLDSLMEAVTIPPLKKM